MDNLMNTVIKHKNTNDVAFLTQAYKDNKDRYEVVGFWINISYPETFFLIRSDKINIKKEDIKNWNKFDISHLKSRT